MPEYTKPELAVALTTIRAIHADYEESLNELLMFVYHLETIEARYEATIPLTIAMREIVR